MMTCKEVSRRVAEGALDDGPGLERLGLWLHFLICAGCRRFRRQVGLLGEAMRLWRAGLRRPDDARRREFEKTVLSRLTRPS